MRNVMAEDYSIEGRTLWVLQQFNFMGVYDNWDDWDEVGGDRDKLVELASCAWVMTNEYRDPGFYCLPYQTVP